MHLFHRKSLNQRNRGIQENTQYWERLPYYLRRHLIFPDAETARALSDLDTWAEQLDAKIDEKLRDNVGSLNNKSPEDSIKDEIQLVDNYVRYLNTALDASAIIENQDKV